MNNDFPDCIGNGEYDTVDKENLTKLIMGLIASQEAITKYLNEKDPDFLDIYLKFKFEAFYREAEKTFKPIEE